MKYRALLPVFYILSTVVAGATTPKEYVCPVEGKVAGDKALSRQEIREAELKVIIRDGGKTASLGKCSFSNSEGRVACTFFAADRITRDKNNGFSRYSSNRARLDVELYSDGSFLQRDGEGAIAHGRCRNY